MSPLAKSSHGRLMSAVIAVLALFLGLDLLILHYRLPMASCSSSATFFAYVGVMFGYFRWAKHPRLAEGTALIGWSVALGLLTPFAVYMAARSPLPLQDRALAHLDQAVGVDVATIVKFISQHRWMEAGSRWTYTALVPLIIAASVLPTLAGKFRAVKDYLIGVSVAVLLGSAAFALVPAVGPWSVYQLHPTAQQAWCGKMVDLLRQGHPYAITGTDAGIVSFPSFHVVLAILSAVCLGTAWKQARIPATVLAVLICASTITTGWHYATDVLGGLAVSGVSIAVARLARD